jgi:hypothetical protein
MEANSVIDPVQRRDYADTLRAAAEREVNEERRAELISLAENAEAEAAATESAALWISPLIGKDSDEE